MTDKKTVRLVGPLQVRTAQSYLADPAHVGWVMTLKPPTRSLEANAKMWALLGEISKHVVWYGRKLTPEDWKHLFTATLKRLDAVPNLDNTGFVALGMHTSTMTVREMSDLIELAQCFAAERGVPSLELAHE